MNHQSRRGQEVLTRWVFLPSVSPRRPLVPLGPVPGSFQSVTPPSTPFLRLVQEDKKRQLYVTSEA
jgi:hypothetical protein